MTRVKICGITTLRDAQVALDAGADMLGFICYPKSPRYIEPERIADILSQLRRPPDRRAVGVFVNEDAERIRRLLDFTGLDLAQLHGDEPPVTLERLEGRAFKALRPASLTEAEVEAEWCADLGPINGPDLLLDAHHPRLYGGTGQRGDWDMAAALAKRYRLLLAGGLTPANVAEAVARVRPWGVDVSSGVERSPGHKDHDALRAFIRAVKG
ncbi:MAG: phosphoribosylanthranilate isomerase [Chloroflexi bacterium]|nr:phosphoribosylanthranilate isomerase [Chloroflexota bacterium]